MSETESAKFRAVIVGGGPVGLCLAHAFTLANIDYVLLEKRDTPVEPSGFSVTLWSHTVRILDQLGLLQEGNAIAHQLTVKHNIWADGSEISQSRLYDKIKEDVKYLVATFNDPILAPFNAYIRSCADEYMQEQNDAVYRD
ncbi:hypothetical protein Sste5346_008022 [Sporothrix stenoceras]|uniref:FAD-binding domain-containing protein n=1 Tax=Sporothrix stenoceras TaxID=5173 RepID=A0ABR3YRD5_9PEZI